jgi:hypothetical protein
MIFTAMLMQWKTVAILLLVASLLLSRLVEGNINIFINPVISCIRQGTTE